MNDASPYVNSVFEQLWWLKTVAPGRKWKEILLKENGQIIARWITCEGNRRFSMPVLTQTLGFWIHPDILMNDVYRNKRKEIINDLISQLHSKCLTISLSPENDYFLPFIWKCFTVSPRISYRIENLNDIDFIYDSFGKIVKKNIKSASNKVTVIESDNILLLHELMEKTFSLQKRRYPFPKELFVRIYTACKEHNAGKLLYAIDKDNNIHSGAFFVFDKHVCYYLIAGTDPKFRTSGANTLLIWEGIKLAARHSQIFDFEGSMIEGIEHYIRQFGGNSVIYFDVKRYGFISELKDVLKPRVKRIIGYK